MRHYDRAELRHLNDGQRYRDYDYVAEDGWSPASDREPARAAEQSAEPAPAAVAVPAHAHREGPAEPSTPQPEPRPQPWLGFLASLVSPRKTLRRLLRRSV